MSRPPQRRAYAPAVTSVTVEYQRSKGKKLVYRISADRHGSYSIYLGDKVMHIVGAGQDYFGKPKWGSKALQDSAIEAAKWAIEDLRGMSEE